MTRRKTGLRKIKIVVDKKLIYLPESTTTYLTTAFEIAKNTESAGISDVDEFSIQLRIFDDLTEIFDDKVKDQCVADRLRGSALKYFEGMY